jgi:DNA gyrase subunit B
MFVGGVDTRGLHYIVDDILVTSLFSGFARSLAVALKKDGSISIAVDGRGFSMPLEGCLTNPPVPTNFHNWNDCAWRIWAIAVANCLSERFTIQVDVVGKVFIQEYRAGAPIGPAAEVRGKAPSGISVAFTPDREIFSDLTFSPIALRNRLEELASLHTGVSISYSDESAAISEHFLFEDGIQAFVERLNQGRRPLHDAVVIRDEKDGIQFEVGIQFCKERQEVIRAYANDWCCPDWGTHVTGVRIALTRSLKRAARMVRALSDRQLKWSTKDNGLTAVISVRMESPQFMGASRSNLGSPEVQRLLAAQIGKRMLELFVANSDAAESIIRAEAICHP